MKTFARILSAIGAVCWLFMCISVATGYITIEPIDYCLAVGLLAFDCLWTAIRGY